jgi:tetratricopeptide (TPR) repeat protein
MADMPGVSPLVGWQKLRVIAVGVTPLVVLLIALCFVPSGPKAAAGAVGGSGGTSTGTVGGEAGGGAAPGNAAASVGLDRPKATRAETANAKVLIDYPEDGSIFPPGITAPTFLWRDGAASNAWEITVSFGDHAAAIHATSHGERIKIAAIDPRCVGPTNELPKLTEKQAAAWTWKPDAATWAAIQQHSVKSQATFTVTGLRDGKPVSTPGHIAFTTSTDPVGAPVFYRDVPLMPSANTDGVVQPLAADAIHLINWRLRDITKPESHTVLTDVPTCLNCHSFAMNGKTMGIDLDGPNNDKGLYALAPIQKRIAVESKNVVQWNTDGRVGKIRVGFMTQVSPNGKYTVSTFSGLDLEFAKTYFVRNFTNYKFLQAFFPTKGILEYYSRENGRRYPLPGADDPNYVQTGGVWSPDGKWIVFARALAKEPQAPGQKIAEYSGDPNETQIQYDLYRIPFNDGKGGEPERIVGASQNGMSNSFPKISPDGKWIVFVQAKNAEIMRPDSQLYIVPFGGGEARRLRANQTPMNSWHSWSPNGHWLVFSSKGRGPFTQMYLTHMDADGNSSPAILVDNTTASNRAVNLPEFVNIPGDGIEDIALPAIDVYRLTEKAVGLEEQKDYDQALQILKNAVTLAPDDAKVHNDLAADYYLKGDMGNAISEVRDAIDLNPALVQGHFNLAAFLLQEGHPDQALPEIEKAIDLNPHFPQGEETLAQTYGQLGRNNDALVHWRRALAANPKGVMALVGAARILASSPDPQLRDGAEAVKLAGQADELTGGHDPTVLDTLGAAYAEAGQYDQALAVANRALEAATASRNDTLAGMIRSRMQLYEAKQPYRN